MADGQIVFEVTADGSNLRTDMRRLTNDIQHETRQWEDSADDATEGMANSFSSLLKKVGGAIAAAKIGQKFLEIGKEAISLASDLQEVQNVVDTTFGADAGKIDTWAKKAATQFGLTEIQAKRFTSTLGAMMKSSGMSGSEITQMSTDLAGLAADMASFYNLDFDTAFQKIRSGISGETEPLKQLGINMSTANLEAFALQQGLNKTWNEMTQGEQTMLRYQYLMQATADAQGDFARTSDGYANSMRTLETNITSLKTKLGEALLPAINDIVSAVNGLFGSDAEEKSKFSILDRINEIQINKEQKIAEINEIANTANNLISTLETISSDTTAASTLTNLAAGANSLNSDSKANWTGILVALRGINGLENLFGEGEAATSTVNDLATALSGNSITTTKAQAWDIFLSALADNAGAVSALTGESVEGTKKWLSGLREEAQKLSPEDAAGWQTLMTALVSGIDLNTEGGQQFIDQLAAQFLAMGSGSAEAVAGLSALGYSTEAIESKQAAWLAVCKELNNTIPGVSDLIDTQTGEIKGGLPALQDYVEAWREAERIQAEINALGEMKNVYNQENNIGTKRGEMLAARAKFKLQLAEQLQLSEQDANEFTDFLQKLSERGIELEGNDLKVYSKLLSEFGNEYDADKLEKFVQYYFSSTFGFVNGEDGQKLSDSFSAYMEALDVLITTEKELPLVNQEIDEGIQDLADSTGYTVEQLENMTEEQRQNLTGMTKLERAAAGEADAMEAVKNAVSGADEALQAMADHAQSVYDSVLQSINNVASSLNRVDYKSFGDQIDKITQLTAEQAKYAVDSDEWKRLQSEIDKANESLVNTSNIYKNLESQSQFLDDYLANIQKAREMGLSDELLAELSDGSVESAQYLDAIVNDKTGKTAAEIDQLYQEIQEKKAALAKELTGQQLTVDQIYQALAEKAKEAIAALNLGQEAKNNAAATIQGIADGIGDKQDEVKTTVDSIIAELERLNGYGIDIDFGGFGNITFTTSTGKTEGSGRMGIPLVPHDDYIARLHEGERVLTAQENQIWNALRNGGVAGFDLETLGGVMRDNVKPGGNVYLDGRVVGSVISDQQGKSYRQLQRSGWQG